MVFLNVGGLVKVKVIHGDTGTDWIFPWLTSVLCEETGFSLESTIFIPESVRWWRQVGSNFFEAIITTTVASLLPSALGSLKCDWWGMCCRGLAPWHGTQPRARTPLRAADMRKRRGDLNLICAAEKSAGADFTPCTIHKSGVVTHDNVMLRQPGA